MGLDKRRGEGERLSFQIKGEERERDSLSKCYANQLLLKPMNLPRLTLSLQSTFPMSLGDADEDTIVGNMTQFHCNMTD